MKYLAKFQANIDREFEGYESESGEEVFSWYERACKVCNYLINNYQPKAELYDNDGKLISVYNGKVFIKNES